VGATISNDVSSAADSVHKNIRSGVLKVTRAFSKPVYNAAITVAAKAVLYKRCYEGQKDWKSICFENLKDDALCKKVADTHFEQCRQPGGKIKGTITAHGKTVPYFKCKDWALKQKDVTKALTECMSNKLHILKQSHPKLNWN
jgi:hypothetical protein